MSFLAFRTGGIVLFAIDGGGFAIRAILWVRMVREHYACSALKRACPEPSSDRLKKLNMSVSSLSPTCTYPERPARALAA
jgi:hypothetical protein